MYPSVIKPILDFATALCLLLLLSPLFVVLFILLFFMTKGKPFFIQKRPGKRERIFSIIKFKTMNNRKDSKGNLLSDEERLTGLGRFIRAGSLDELPQLINVILGDMSLVGPRPLLVQYLPLYNDFQKQRHQVRPGITGWAQINGRNAISWEEKFEMDVYYVQNVTFTLDLRILFGTIAKVFKREGINNRDAVTMEVFRGTKQQ